MNVKPSNLNVYIKVAPKAGHVTHTIKEMDTVNDVVAVRVCLPPRQRGNRLHSQSIPTEMD